MWGQGLGLDADLKRAKRRNNTQKKAEDEKKCKADEVEKRHMDREAQVQVVRATRQSPQKVCRQ